MEIIRTGNIENYDINKNMPEMYLGSGDMGASFDKFGTTDSSPERGIMHGDFYGKNTDYNITFYTHTFKTRFLGIKEDQLTDYAQKLDIYDGILTTKMGTKNYQFTGRIGFHPEKRNIFAAEYTWEGETLPTLCFVPMPEYREESDWQAKMVGTTTIRSIRMTEEILHIDFCAGVVEGYAKLKVSGDADVSYDEENVFIKFKDGKGKAEILMALCKDEQEAENQLGQMPEENVIADVAQAWHRRWGDSRISFDGHEELLKLYYRSIFHMLCSYSENNRFIAPPMGWAGRNWRYHFPQDFEYMAPAMLRLGYVDILKSKVEMYAGYIENLRENTKRIYNCDGVMWTWEFPIDGGKDHLPEGKAPYVFMYEIHNSVYPAKLAGEPAAYVQDEDWSRKYAWNIIKESADFFASGAKYNGKTWDIDIQPAMGQDELGGFGKKNYLCALYAARYTFTIALKAAKEWKILCPETDKWEKILSDGLAFEKLIHPEQKLYMTYEGDWKEYELGKMKHPIPLNPISFLPLGEPDPYEINAYKRRYDLCDPLPKIWGWSLVDIMLAAAHMGDSEAFWEGYELFKPSHTVDEDWTVIFESSEVYEAYPYITNEMLLCRAILDGIACDCWGDIRYNGVKFENVKYKNLHLQDGTVISNWE